MRGFAALLVLLPAAQEEDRLHVKQAEDSFQRRWAAAEEAGDWKVRVDLHAYACDRLADCLAQPDPAGARWIALPRLLAAKLSQMPPAARETHETVARQLLETLQERAARRSVIEKYAWTTAGLDALEAWANEDFDQGRIREAVRGWTRSLETRYSPDLVARLAYAHAAAGDRQALAALAGLAEKNAWKGEVSIAGRKRPLGEFLSGLRPAAAPVLRPAAAPYPTGELPLGAYDLKGDGNAYGRGFGLSIPAGARLDGREHVVLTNGTRAIALDPARAQGGTLEDAVDWRYPRDSAVRYYVPSVYGRPYPSVGAVIEGRRVFVTMFSSVNRQTQVGRRSDRFDGPAAVRALDLATGELLWETDGQWPEGSGEKGPTDDHRDFWRYNFCFAGPPLVRGDRLYAVAMTVTPYRQAHVVCFEAATGRMRWNTWVASAPAASRTTSVPQIAEEDGTIVLSTGFGVLAALDTRSGEIEWLVKHRTATASRFARSAPVLYRSVVYVLPQDCEELLAFDRWTGREIAAIETTEEVSWSQVQALLGRSGDWLVLSGRKSWAVRLTDGKVVELAGDDTERAGHGTLAGPHLFLPARGALHVYDTSTWVLRESHPRAADDSPNVVATDSLLLLMGDRLELATSRESLRLRFAGRADANPPRAEACRQLATILEGAGRAAEAVPYYRRALGVWEKDPAWAESAEGLRKKLADLAEKLGDEFPKK